MGVRENKVEKYLDAEVTKLGGLTRKWVCPGHDGVPDRIVILHGRVVFVEVKTVEGRLSNAQVREHARLKGVEALVVTVSGSAEVDKLVKKLNTRTGLSRSGAYGP